MYLNGSFDTVAVLFFTSISFHLIPLHTFNDVQWVQVQTSRNNTVTTPSNPSVTLWFNFTIYHCTIPRVDQNRTFLCDIQSPPFLNIIGPSRCYRPGDTNTAATIMIENKRNLLLFAAKLICKMQYDHLLSLDLDQTHHKHICEVFGFVKNSILMCLHWQFQEAASEKSEKSEKS
eukprot:219735_1